MTFPQNRQRLLRMMPDGAAFQIADARSARSRPAAGRGQAHGPQAKRQLRRRASCAGSGRCCRSTASDAITCAPLSRKSPTPRSRGSSRGVWDNLGRVAVEFAHLDEFCLEGARPANRRRHHLPAGRADRYDRMIENGKPTLGFAAHLANWELPAVGRASARRRNRPCSIGGPISRRSATHRQAARAADGRTDRRPASTRR